MNVPKEPTYSKAVHQALGIIAEQMRGTITDAAVLIEAHAAASGMTVDQVAEAVIDGQVRFE